MTETDRENVNMKPINGLNAVMTEESTTPSVPRSQDAGPKTRDENKSKTGTQFLAASVASLTGFMLGQNVAWSSPVTPLLIKNQTITKEEESWIVSILNFGAIIGCLTAGYVNKYMGRKTVLLIVCIPAMVGWLMLAFCEGLLLLCFARFLAGVCVGFFCVTGPMYISEIAQTSVRGALATLFQLSITVGILYTFLLGLLEDSLQITLGSSIIVVLFACLFIMMPETPVYLLSVDKHKEASASLQWLRGRGYNINQEKQALEEIVRESKDTKASWSEFISDSGTFRALIIALGLFFFQQMAGVNAVVFYLNTVFETSGSSLPPTTASIIIGIVQMFATALSVYLMDKAGRKFLFIFSLIACSICIFVLGLCFYLKKHGVDLSSVGWIPLLSVASYLVFFAMGLGPTPWTMIGELFNKNISSLAMSVATANHWLLAFIVTKGYATCEYYLGTGQTFWMFSVWCWIGVVFSCFLLPETKGRDLQDILDELKGKPKSELPRTSA